MNALYNYILGRKNSSTSYVTDDGVSIVSDAVVNEVVDENGFVMVKSEDRQQTRCTQVFPIQLFSFFYA